MSILKGILTDLRQRRLWPVPLALIAAIAAVPFVLAKTPASTPMAPLPSSPGPSAGTPVAAISVNTSPSSSHPAGRARDPFTQQVLPAKLGTSLSSALGRTAGGVTASVTGGSGAAGTFSSTGGTSTSGGSTSASTGGGSSIPSSSSSSPIRVSTVPAQAKPKPAPSGLAADQAYHVAVSVSTASGSVDVLDPLTRLTPLPSAQAPLLVELGVLQGGKRVLFAVQPGTTVSGAGTCTTGPIDCEIVSLGQDQVETASAGSRSVQFAVTAITADTYPTSVAANAARQAVSADGSRLLAGSSLGALSLFQYQPQVGALVDLRDLTVGGN